MALVSLRGPRRISVGFLYRWMCPLLVAGFGLAILLGPGPRAYEAFSVSMASRLAFCLITQLYFARVAAAGWLTATQSFGWGWICVHGGDLAGYLVVLQLGSLGWDAVSLCVGSIIAMVFVTMYVVNDPQGLGGLWAAVPAGDAGAVRDGAGRVAVPEPPSEGEGLAPAPPLPGDAGAGVDALGARVERVAGDAELTPRETEVLLLLAQGRSAPFIRDALVISKGTVTTHMKHIYKKLDVHSRQELIDLVRGE